MKIVVTGALGHLGAKLCTHLVELGHVVNGIDLNNADTPVLVKNIDLSNFSTELVSFLGGAQVIIHLAAERSPDASWSTIIPNNMDAVLNLFEAARQAGVPKFIFASSNWLMGGKRFGVGKLSPDMTPDPINPYGMSKLMGERIGSHYAKVHGMSVICVRIGWTQWTHGNKPGPHMAMGRWGQLMWLSDQDFLNGITAATMFSTEGFIVVNLMSNNPGMRWSLDETKSKIGFTPTDGAAARLNLAVRLKEFGAWTRQVAIPIFTSKFIGKDW